MKCLLPTLLFSALLFSCASEREIQADMIEVTLVKVELINRYPNLKQKLLTWKTETDVTYITFEEADAQVAVGAKSKVLIKR